MDEEKTEADEFERMIKTIEERISSLRVDAETADEIADAEIAEQTYTECLGLIEEAQIGVKREVGAAVSILASMIRPKDAARMEAKDRKGGYAPAIDAANDHLSAVGLTIGAKGEGR
jgi:hypothetical protein